MSEAVERGLSPQDAENVLSRKMTRRAVVASAAGGLLGLSKGSEISEDVSQMGEEIVNLARDHVPFLQRAYHEYDEYTQGAVPLTSDELREITETFDWERVPHVTKKETGTPHNIFDLTFTTERDAYLVGAIQGQFDPDISVPVVEADFQASKHVSPLIQSSEINSSRVMFGDVKKGENHAISISHTDFSKGVSTDTLGVDLYTVSSSDPIGNALLRAMQGYGLREDNVNDPAKGVVNDAIFRTFGNVRRFPNGEWLVEVWADYFKEPGKKMHPRGGTNPIPLWEKFGRTYDREVVTLLTLSPDGRNVLKFAHQDDGHDIVEDYNFEEDPVPFDDFILPNLVSIPAHGMVTVGENSSGHVFSQFVDFGSQDENIGELIFAAEVESKRQHLRQGSLRPDDPPITEFVENALGGNNIVSSEEYWNRTYQPLTS